MAKYLDGAGLAAVWEKCKTVFAAKTDIVNNLTETTAAKALDAQQGKVLREMIGAKNLLDNSDFRNAVNQRGATAYNASGYMIDRWRMWSTNGDGTVTIESGGIAINPNTSPTVSISQRFRYIDTTKMYTLAYMKDDGTIGIKNSPIVTVSGYYYVDIAFASLTKIVWAALYEGAYTANTIPPYIPKGYGMEMAECQRYYQLRSTNSVAGVDLRPSMRLTSPTVTQATGGYAYSADL